MTPNQYIVRAKGNIESDQDYVSNIYKSEGSEPIIVLPRIVLVLNKGKTIAPILNKITNVTVEETNGIQYILRCDVNHSEKVLNIIELLNGMVRSSGVSLKCWQNTSLTTLFIRNNTTSKIQDKMEERKVLTSTLNLHGNLRMEVLT